MKINKYKQNNILINYVDIDKFKTTIALLTFKIPATPKCFMEYSILSKILVNSCSKYNDNKKLNINCMENYGASYYTNSSRDGRYIIFKIGFDILDDKYTEDGNLKKVIDTFYEIIFNPNIENELFNENEFNIAYQALKTNIESEKENPKYYSLKQINNMMGKGTLIEHGDTISMINSITNADVYRSYLDLLNKAEVALYIAGNKVNLSYFDSIIKNIKSKNYKRPLYIETKINKKIKVKKEKYDGMQSIIMVGLKFKNLTNFQRSYVVPVFNSILGAGASSRLFNVVREKNSLCYSIFSKYEKDDNLAIIMAGIENKSFDKTKKLILEVVDSMDNILLDEVNDAKADIISTLKENLDNLSSYVYNYCYSNLYNEKSMLEKIKIFKSIKLKDVLEIKKHVFVTDIFFLEGESNEN